MSGCYIFPGIIFKKVKTEPALGMRPICRYLAGELMSKNWWKSEGCLLQGKDIGCKQHIPLYSITSNLGPDICWLVATTFYQQGVFKRAKN